MQRFSLRLLVAGLVLTSLGMIGVVRAENADQQVPRSELTREAILQDPAAPTFGNPKGDVTIVAFEDYNCPFCKKADPALRRVVREDGHIRLVYKDWPILTVASAYGAEVALAAKYQGKYMAVHDALMAIRGRADKAAMDQAVHQSGVDIARLNKDLAAHREDIRKLLRRNNAQALGMGFRGTPVFLIGPYLVAAALDYDGFKKVVAQAREHEGK